MSKCKQCGYCIVQSIIPRQQEAQGRGFCCVGCQEAYEQVKKWELDQAGNE